jgi:glycerophosphoryl diester phosphodiesterase
VLSVATIEPAPAGTQGNPWTARRVLTYAHQGGAWEAPSSTLFAIRRALELGVTGVELDVHATADGVLVVGHDRTVDRTTSGAGAIASLTLAELRALDNAYWFAPGADVTPGLPATAYPYRGRGPADGDFRIATLAEVLELLGDWPTVALNLDIKATAPDVAPYEALLADELRRAGRTERVIVASFIDAATDAFSAEAPAIAVSAGTNLTAAFVGAVRSGARWEPTRHVALQVPARVGELIVVDEPLVEAARAAGMAVHVWTINDETEMERLLDLGVDGIISDVPTVLVDTVARRGLTYRA